MSDVERRILYDSRGEIREEVLYVNNLKHGIQKRYNQDGVLIEEIPWVYDKKHGTERCYYSCGRLEMEITWANDERHGIEKCYHINGCVYCETVYYNGQKHGKQIRHYLDKDNNYTMSVNIFVRDMLRNDLKRNKFAYLIIFGESY